MSQKNHARNRKFILNFIGSLLLVIATVGVLFMIYIRSKELQHLYGEYLNQLSRVEEQILALPKRWLILLVVFLLYIIKAWVPILPVSALCFITGVIYPFYVSFAINVLGVVGLVSIKYYWGRHKGGGNIHKLLSQSEGFNLLLERNGNGNPWILLVARLVPSFPINTVSQIYGAMGFDYSDYVLISLLGFLPKLLSYTIMGRNVFNPLSTSFLLPIVLISGITGISMLIVNMIMTHMMKERKYDSQ